jgi:hypothetical protein
MHAPYCLAIKADLGANSRQGPSDRAALKCR